MGLYSNPYLSSFDFLIYLGILPLLATHSENFKLSNLTISLKKSEKKDD
jgi:hypothetical protein